MRESTAETDFVLFRVFTILPNVDLLRASRVCKRWRNICKNPTFEWAKVFSCTGECVDIKIQVFDVRVKRICKVCESMYMVEDVQGILGKQLVETASESSFDWCIEAATLADLLPKLWKCTVTTALSMKGTRVRVKVQLNVKEFNRIYPTEEAGAKESALLLSSSIKWKTDRMFTQSEWESVKPLNFSGSGPTKPVVPQGLTLYDYQIEAVNWMKTIESKRKYRGQELDYIRVPHQAPVLYSRKYDRFINAQDALMYLPVVSPRGGFLIDDVGLGKTIEVISLILSNPLPYNEVNHKCKSAIIGNASNPAYLFMTKATLVLCPPHIVQHWKQELTQHTTKTLKVVVLTDIRDVSQHTFGDIQSADVVIASFSLLTLHAYCSLGTTTTTNKSNPLKPSKSNPTISKTKSNSFIDLKSGGSLGKSNSTNSVNKRYSTNTYNNPTPVNKRYSANTYNNPNSLNAYAKSNSSSSLKTKTPKTTPYRSILDMDKVFKPAAFPIPKPPTTTSFLDSEFFKPAKTPEKPLFEKISLSTSEETKKPTPLPAAPPPNPFENRPSLLTQYLASLKSEFDMGLGTKNPILELFYFHRVVIDEAHELCDESLGKAIGLLNASTWWFVSGAPIEQSTRLKLAYLLGLGDMDRRFCDSMIYDYFMWRNTKCTLDINQYLSTIQEHVVTIPDFLTPLERVTYEMLEVMGSEHHDLFCSLPYQKKHLDNLNHWHNFYLESLFQELVTSMAGIKKFQTKYEKHQKRYQKISQKLGSLGYLDKRSAEKKLNLASEKRDYYQQIFQQYGASFCEYLWRYSILSSVKNASTGDFSNFNVLEPVSDQAVAEGTARKRSSKEALTPQMEEELSEFTIAGHPQKREPSELVTYCAINYGTKITYLMLFLRNIWLKDPNSKVIIFSQFVEVLDAVAAHLRKSGVACAISKEGSSQNWEQVDSFQASEKVRVLLTDYSSNSSGANFVKATTVVFLDPVNVADRLAALQIEAMALGKTHRLGQHNNITVLRFVVENTVEHEHFLLVHPEHQSTCKKRNTIPKLQTQAQQNTLAYNQQQMKEVTEKHNAIRKQVKVY
eukprot:Phypoly_transcript_01344.p1 GENE.Phypoly_transcript_01344~~Phypoly_transcript_01344.p1  ORF type:complete len:1070 (+),score=137.73 Phypoly_transcript_01344:60-3269(+)